MNKAFVFINTDKNVDESVFDIFKTVDGIKDIYKMEGAYDLALRVEADSVEYLRELIQNKIRKSQGITSTSTLVVMAN